MVMNQHEKALEYFKKASEIQKQLKADSPLEVINIEMNLALSLNYNKKHAEARELCQSLINTVQNESSIKHKQYLA